MHVELKSWSMQHGFDLLEVFVQCFTCMQTFVSIMDLDGVKRGASSECFSIKEHPSHPASGDVMQGARTQRELDDIQADTAVQHQLRTPAPTFLRL